MILRRLLCPLLLAVASGTMALGQVKFERKIHDGTSSKTESVSKTEQKLTIAGMEIDSGSNTRSIVKATAGKRDAAGNVRIQEQIESLQISINAQGTEYEFDSANPEKAGGSALEILRPVHKGMARRTTTTTFDMDNKVAQIEFDLDPLNDLPDMVRGLVKDQFDVERLKKAANEELERLPAEPVQKGDSWDRTTKLGLGAGQIMTVGTRYTYEGEIEQDGRKLERISSKITSVEFTIEDSPLNLSVKSSELKPESSTGELLFDRAQGQIVESKSAIRIVGDLTLVINGQELPSKLDLKIDSSTKKLKE